MPSLARPRPLSAFSCSSCPLVRALIALVPDPGEIDGAVEEHLYGAGEFRHLYQFERMLGQHFFGDVFPDVFLRRDDRQNQLTQRNSLVCAAFSDSHVAMLDFAFRFVLQPLAQIGRDLVAALKEGSVGISGALGEWSAGARARSVFTARPPSRARCLHLQPRASRSQMP